jgi:hypothetical protein
MIHVLIRTTIVYLLLTSTLCAQPDRGTFVAERQTMVSEQRVALVIGNADMPQGRCATPSTTPGRWQRPSEAAGSRPFLLSKIP